MTDEQIIETARESLPFLCDTPQPTFEVAVYDHDRYSANIIALNTPYPSLGDSPVFIVEFRKQIISGVVLWWNFVSISK